MDALRVAAHPRWVRPYLLVTALVVPLLYTTATIDPGEPLRFLVIACLGVVLVTAFGVGILRSSRVWSVRRAAAIVVGCLVAYTLVAALSALVAGVTPDGVLEVLELATLAWLIHAGALAVDGERCRLEFLAKAVIVASFLVGGFAVFQYYQVPLFEWMKRDVPVDSTLGHRNLLASFLALALPFVAYGFFELNGPWRLASGATMLVSLFLVVALQSRSVWVACAAGLVFSLLSFVFSVRRTTTAEQRGSRTRPRMLQVAGLAAVGMCLALLVPSPSARAPMREHAGSLVHLQQASIQERLELWSRTIRMIGDHPLTGVGPGNWRVAIPTYDMAGLRSETGRLQFQRPHDDFLWAASETGLVGGLLYLAMFVCTLWFGVSALLRAESSHQRLVLALMLFGITCYVVDSLFSFPKERTSHSVYLALLIGTLLSFHRPRGGQAAVVVFSRRWTIVLLVLAWGTTLVAAGFALSRYRAEVHLRRALEARAGKDWPQMIADLDRIDRRVYAMDPTSAPIAWYRGVARFEMGDRTGAHADFKRALEVHPNHAHVLNNIATCETLDGDHENAIRHYTRAIELAPRFEEARTNLGAVLHSLGRDQQAYEALAPIAATATSARFAECFRSVKSSLGMETGATR
jgi:O-antigen ligase